MDLKNLVNYKYKLCVKCGGEMIGILKNNLDKYMRDKCYHCEREIYDKNNGR